MTTSSDAIVMLRERHKELRRVFREFEKAKDGTQNKQQRLVDKLIKLLTEHIYLETQVVYPRLRELVPGLEDEILKSLEEHNVTDFIIKDLAVLRPEDQRFRPKAMVLVDHVRHHMDEAEQRWFPRAREALGRKELQEVGTEMKQVRKDAPDPPQPGPIQKAVDAVFA